MQPHLTAQTHFNPQTTEPVVIDPDKFISMVSTNLLLGTLIVLIALFLGALFTLTYCVMQSFEKETSELGASEDEKVISQPSQEGRIGVDGNPVIESDDEEFIF